MKRFIHTYSHKLPEKTGGIPSLFLFRLFIYCFAFVVFEEILLFTGAINMGGKKEERKSFDTVRTDVWRKN